MRRLHACIVHAPLLCRVSSHQLLSHTRASEGGVFQARQAQVSPEEEAKYQRFPILRPSAVCPPIFDGPDCTVRRRQLPPHTCFWVECVR